MLKCFTLQYQKQYLHTLISLHGFLLFFLHEMTPFLPLNDFFELENGINGPRKNNSLRSWKYSDLYIKVLEKVLEFRIGVTTGNYSTLFSEM